MPERGMLTEPRHDEPTGRELAIDVMGLRTWIVSELKRIDEHALRELHRVDEHLAAELLRIHERVTMHAEQDTQRFEDQAANVSTALLAQKELNAVVQAASDRAITKAEESQKAVNERNNEFRAQLKEQNDVNISRVEALGRIDALQAMIKDNDERAAKARELQREDIIELREAYSRELGRQSQQLAGKTDNRGTMALIVSAIGVGLVLLTSTGMLRGPAATTPPSPSAPVIIVPAAPSPAAGGPGGSVTDTKSTTVPK